MPIFGVLSRSINTRRFSSTLAIPGRLRRTDAALAAGRRRDRDQPAMRVAVMDAVQRVREGFSLAKGAAGRCGRGKESPATSSCFRRC